MTDKEDKAQKLKEIQARLAEIQNKGDSGSSPTPKPEKKEEKKENPLPPKKETPPVAKKVSPPVEKKEAAKKVIKEEVKKEAVKKEAVKKEGVTQEEKNWRANRVKEEAPKEAVKPSAKKSDGKKKEKKKVRMSLIYTIISLIITISIAGYFVYTNFMSDNSTEIQSSIPTSDEAISEEESIASSDDTEATSEGELAEETDEIAEEEIQDVVEEAPPKQEPPVNKRTLKEESPAPKKERSVVAQSEVPNGFIISYSVNSNTSTAETNVLKLQGRGFKAGYYYMPDRDPKNKSLYRVFVGPYNTKAEAWDALSKVSKIEARAFIMDM